MAVRGADDEDEERAALELELAEALAALSPLDVGLDDNLERLEGAVSVDGVEESYEVQEDYVRLDLDAVLQQMAQSSMLSEQSERREHDREEEAPAPSSASSWTLLMESVARSEREFFGPISDELVNLRTSILASTTPQPCAQEADAIERPPCRQEELEHEARAQIELPCGMESLSNDKFVAEDKYPPLRTASGASEAQVNVQIKSDPLQDSAVDLPAVSDGSVAGQSDNTLLISDVPAAPSASSCSPCRNPDTLVVSLPCEGEYKPGNAIASREDVHGEELGVKEELQAIAKQHAAREARRQKVQEQQQKAREQTEKLLLQLQEDFEVHEKNIEAARREEGECVRMAAEEIRCHLHAAAEREGHEGALLTLEDKLSRDVEAELVKVKAAMDAEIVQMQAEEQIERHRMRMEKQLRQQEELGLSRCRFGAVVLELQEKFEAQRRQFELEKKRERREGVEMRSEEAQQRRAMVQERLLLEQQTRGRERVAMEHEDELARAVEALELERKSQEYCCIAMDLEDEQSRLAWIYLTAQTLEETRRREAQRLEWLDNVSVGIQALVKIRKRHGLACGLEKWQHWHCRYLEAEKARAAREEDAARRLQTWIRLLRRRFEALTIATTSSHEAAGSSDTRVFNAKSEGVTTENQEAARRLQSTFRGFHVRRKFAHALALAQTVGEVDVLDAFHAVDLEDLIQLPPELDDGWEDPVLPVISATTHTQQQQQLQQQQENWDDAVSEDDEAGQCTPETEDRPEADELIVREAVNGASEHSAGPAEETNLAAILWSKMRRVKKRQQHAKEERQRQQDPAYRVQKLLQRQPSRRAAVSTSSSNQSGHSKPQTSQAAQRAVNTVTWSSNSNAKKRPKVKLPSLVERLRKQTLAER